MRTEKHKEDGTLLLSSRRKEKHKDGIRPGGKSLSLLCTCTFLTHPEEILGRNDEE